MGAIVPEGSGVSPDKGLVGPVEHWIEAIVKLYREDRMDTFVFWPVAGDEQAQIEVFAREVVPAVRAALSGGV